MSTADDKIRHPEPELTQKKIVPTDKYGLLKVWEWPDGTVLHLNTEKGKENMRIYHSSGSYSEYRSDGTHVTFTSNNGVTYSKGGVTFSYDNNADTKVAGHMRISVGHDAHIEVAKNASIMAGGSADVHSTGHIKLSAADLSLSTTEGSIVFAAARDIELKADKGRVLIHASQAIQLTTEQGDIHAEAAGDLIAIANGADIRLNATGKIISSSDGDNEIRPKGKLKVKADGKILIDAKAFKVGTSEGNWLKSDSEGTTIESGTTPPTSNPHYPDSE